MVSIVQYLFYSVRTPRQAKRTRNLYDRRMVYQPCIDLIEQNTLVEEFFAVITLCLFDREFIVAEIGVHICVRDLDVLLLGDSLEDKQARDAVLDLVVVGIEQSILRLGTYLLQVLLLGDIVAGCNRLDFLTIGLTLVIKDTLGNLTNRSVVDIQ